MKLKSFLAGFAIAAGIVGATFGSFPAQAGVLTVLLEGVGSGSLGKTSFSGDPFTFELSGADTGGHTGIKLTTAEIFIPALSGSGLSISGPSLINLNFTPNYAFLRPDTNNGGVSTAADYAHIFFTATDFSNLSHNSGVVIAFPTGVDFLNSIPTSGGTLTFSRDPGPTSLFFQAIDTPSVSAVPELSTWMMMLIGFAGIGLAAYRRARAAVVSA